MFKKVLALCFAMGVVLGMTTIVYAFEELEAIKGTYRVRVCVDSEIERIRSARRSSAFEDEGYICIEILLDSQLHGMPVYVYTFYVTVSPAGEVFVTEGGSAANGRTLANSADLRISTILHWQGVSWSYTNLTATLMFISNTSINLLGANDIVLDRHGGNFPALTPRGSIEIGLSHPNGWVTSTSLITVNGIRLPLMWLAW